MEIYYSTRVKKKYINTLMNWIAPAMREDGSEFDKDLSDIIQLNDINGDIHMHTTYSDGAFSIRDMIEANIAKGYQFMVITDHSQSLKSCKWITG